MQHTNEETYTGMAGMKRSGEDMVDSGAHELDNQARRMTGSSALHWATLLSIGASITLFLAGKRELAIFIGLWPPTFQALKANAERTHAHAHSHDSGSGLSSNY